MSKTQTIGWSGTILILLVLAGATIFTDDYRQMLTDNPSATYIMLDYAENEKIEFITRGVGDFLRWKYTEDKWTLYSGRYIGLEEDWLVYRQRTYLDLSKVSDTSICSKITATRCYVDDYFEPLDRKRTLVSLDYIDLDGSIAIYKNTPYYAYPYASGNGGTLFQTALITDSSSFDQFPENYTVHFEPAMASNYQLVWRINAKPLSGVDYSNLGCSVDFKYNMKVSWCDELAFVEHAEWDDSRNQLRVYFNPTTGPQTYSVIAVDPVSGNFTLDGLYDTSVRYEFGEQANVSVDLMINLELNNTSGWAFADYNIHDGQPASFPGDTDTYGSVTCAGSTNCRAMISVYDGSSFEHKYTIDSGVKTSSSINICNNTSDCAKYISGVNNQVWITTKAISSVDDDSASSRYYLPINETSNLTLKSVLINYAATSCRARVYDEYLMYYNEGEELCFNIAHPQYGYNYTCTNSSFLINLSDYLNITPSKNSLYNFMSFTNETNSTPFLDSFLDVINWMFDILGTKSDFTISQFDNPLGETIEINLSSTNQLNLSIWNQSNNDMSQIEFKVKSSGGTAITNLTINMGNNNYTDYNTSSIGVWTTVEFNVSRWDSLGDITSPPSKIITIPFVFGADAGENISITDIIFKREAVYYPKDLYIDIGNSSYNDIYLGGTIGSSGSVDEFVEGFEVGTQISGPPLGASDLVNTSSTYSVLKHLRLSPDATVNQYIAGTPYWTAIGYKEYFDFRNESLINTSETTASLFTTSGVIISNGQNSKVQSIPLIKDINFSHVKVRSQGEGIAIQEGLEIAYDMDNGMNYTFFVSNDGGSNWINFTINETWTEFQNFSAANDTLVWKMNFNGTSTYTDIDYGYLWRIELQTADADWYNATIDFGNDGTIDWRESNSTNMSAAKTREDALNNYLTNNCTKSFCDVPLNFSWRGPGRYYYLFSEVIYNLTKINPPVNPLNFYLSNKNTSLSNITDFNGSATSSINTSQNAYLAIPREVIVHDFNLTITGASP